MALRAIQAFSYRKNNSFVLPQKDAYRLRLAHPPFLKGMHLDHTNVGLNSDHYYLVEIAVDGIARVFLAINRHSVDSPISLVTPNDSDSLEPHRLRPTLNVNSSYGGTRAEPYCEDMESGRRNALTSLLFLAQSESLTKHTLINAAIEGGALSSVIDEMDTVTKVLRAQNTAQRDIPIGYKVPDPYRYLRFLGGRCVILPLTPHVYEVLLHPKHQDAHRINDAIFSVVGRFLNGRADGVLIDALGEVVSTNFRIPCGALFLTPDFGPNAQLANIANEHTPQILGVKPEVGGGAGKSAYTVSGFMGAFVACMREGLLAGHRDLSNVPITIIGAGGEMGADTCRRLASGCDFAEPIGTATNVRVCDLRFDSWLTKAGGLNIRTADEHELALPGSWRVIDSAPGRFTDEALRGDGTPGVIIAMTWGRELENSNIDVIPEGSLLLMAHNFSFPEGVRGIEMSRRLAMRGIWAFPGQLLTAGGAANSRLEIAFRASRGYTKAHEGLEIEMYPKRLGHELVFAIMNFLAEVSIRHCRDTDESPLEAMANYLNRGFPAAA